jgi:ADP-heptose:LPS heptosyltransferase
MNPIPERAVWVRIPRFIGDGIMMSQALEPLRQAGIPLVAWGPEKSVDLYRGSNAFAAVHADEPAGRHVFTLARVLRCAKAAGVISLTRSLRPLLAGWLARVPRRLGWQEAGGRWFATHSAPWWDLSRHHCDRYEALVRMGFPGLPTGFPLPTFRPRPEAEASAASLRQASGIAPGFVALALGGNEWNKRLGLGPWHELILRLEVGGLPAVLLGIGPDDDQMAQSLMAGSRWPVNLVGTVGLAETAALLRQAGGLVGNDSALAHMASAVGCPVVAIFGPTRPEWSAPRGQAVRVIRREDLPCLPCAVHGCAVPGHPCMQDLPAERIWSALQEVLLPPDVATARMGHA